jgi:membrane protease YdiL (CAAX protease family)
MNHPTVLGLLGMAIIEVVLTLIVTGFSYSARKSGTRGRTLGAAWIVAVVVFVTTAFSSAILDSVGNLGFSILVLAGALVSLACSLAVALSLGKLYGCLPKELFSLRLPPGFPKPLVFAALAIYWQPILVLFMGARHIEARFEPVSFYLATISTVILEEVYYRFFLIHLLYETTGFRKWSKILVPMACSLFFALMHVEYVEQGEWLVILYMWGAGLGLSYLAMTSKSIAYPIILHFIWNVLPTVIV